MHIEYVCVCTHVVSGELALTRWPGRSLCALLTCRPVASGLALLALWAFRARLAQVTLVAFRARWAVLASLARRSSCSLFKRNSDALMFDGERHKGLIWVYVGMRVSVC